MGAEVNVHQPLRIVVSGGIGSGKSTVVQMLSDMGAVVVEADLIGHEVLEPGGPAHAAVARRWPATVRSGRIDRKRLAAVVFTDVEQLALLESLTHPHIKHEIERRVDAAGSADVVVELPLAVDLLGSGWTRVVVDAPDELRLRRSVAKGMAETDVSNRIAMQPSRPGWVAGADIVIENTGTIAELTAKVHTVWDRLHGGGDD